ncbi:unnamed protein product [Cuscuta epithymum]|uniref:Uncharacterized protein n=1 Tax=Cuscuta epithymum TaxID=186058 RepID=A0AAV0FKD9_9ASTE|nr:unnamed protein product [Cuscuta epithymum]
MALSLHRRTLLFHQYTSPLSSLAYAISPAPLHGRTQLRQSLSTAELCIAGLSSPLNAGSTIAAAGSLLTAEHHFHITT